MFLDGFSEYPDKDVNVSDHISIFKFTVFVYM